jgi:hydroxyacylglutathione hydrolase
VALAEGGEVRLGADCWRVFEVAGHTLDHLALVFDDDRVAFVGDTLFAMGCGRLFEGTPAQMFDSLQRFARLPEDTKLYPAHEYTLANARFAAVAEPDNAAIAARLDEVRGLRDAGEITLPTTVAEERATNPFVRAADVAELARLRAEKDMFR